MEPVKKSPERIILAEDECEIIKRWTEALNQRAEGLIRFTKSDVVNFLIRSHPEMLTQEERQGISAACYEETRWLGWAMNRLRDAKKKGQLLSLDDLMKFRDGLLGQGTRKTRKKEEGNSKAELPAESISFSTDSK